MATKFQILDRPIDDVPSIKAICVGAGVSGILTGIRLPQRVQNLELVIYEKSPELGGTWLENTYPGGMHCRYIPAAAYQLSFENNTQWSSYYASGPEILEYWKRVAHKYDVFKYMKFNTEVTEARWNADDGLWAVKLKDTNSGKEWSDSGNFLIIGTGILNKFDWPNIPGLHDFKGHLVHTARWDHSYDFTDKKVALIGGGSSGIQILPKIQPLVKHCDHYMKGRTWIAYRIPGKEISGMNPDNLENFQHTEEDLAKWRNDPAAYLDFRCAVEDNLNSAFDFIRNGTEVQTKARKLFEDTMKERLSKKPEVFEALRPEYPPGCRRLTPGPGYLKAICEDNVNFISIPIERVVETGIIASDEIQRDVDAIICATGFDYSYKPRIPTYGLGGKILSEVWESIPEAYLSMCPSQMPNYFLYLGPNGGPGNGSTIIFLELVAEYICKAVHKVQREGLKSMVPKDEPIKQFGQYVDKYMELLTELCMQCRSWFKRGQEEGRVVALWPGGSMAAIKALQHPRWEDFNYTLKENTAVNMWSWFGNGTTKAQQERRSTSDYLRHADVPPVPTKRPSTVAEIALGAVTDSVA
ncbi:uncharacterized protein A1O5_06338 [Cladophialophora psammophila CBS 110553]|uniref:FAD/NAD(P)-binding domain-containing protein n=1 Tax=Cladophialophora psammophila CBS 110553 TaxID=1182543 RepID=W9WYW0_9EURO|nr:uncharacterized protein A1O5_06338 [Cladophialophora psammophila CBS 110553]EXJ70270.1 hypothetical protein A1O5_06338 [Cladophialophora psammophila CBS 110553]